MTQPDTEEHGYTILMMYKVLISLFIMKTFKCGQYEECSSVLRLSQVYGP